MDILTLFIVVPLTTVLILLFTKGLERSRIVAMIGSLVQLGMAINLVFAYMKEKEVNEAIMVFIRDVVWFENFNIHYTIIADSDRGIGRSVHLLENVGSTQRILYFVDRFINWGLWIFYLNRSVHYVRIL